MPSKRAKAIPAGLSAHLLPIVELELSLGNSVKRVHRYGGRDPQEVEFARPLHFDRISKSLKLSSLVAKTEDSPGNPAGFFCSETGQGLDAPPLKAPLSTEEKLRRLSPGLRRILTVEMKLGNKVMGIDEPAKGRWDVYMRDTLHFERLRIPPGIVSWENTDPHYPLAVGLMCKRTGHSVEGPWPQVPPSLPGIVREIMKELARRDYDALSARSGSKISPEAFRLAVSRFGEHPRVPPPQAYTGKRKGVDLSTNPLKFKPRMQWIVGAVVYTREDDWESGTLSFELVLTAGPTGEDVIIRDLAAVRPEAESPEVSALQIEKERRASGRRR